jgi:predicted alpha/beta-hydrolase family hydrolase
LGGIAFVVLLVGGSLFGWRMAGMAAAEIQALQVGGLVFGGSMVFASAKTTASGCA